MSLFMIFGGWVNYQQAQVHGRMILSYYYKEKAGNTGPMCIFNTKHSKILKDIVSNLSLQFYTKNHVPEVLLCEIYTFIVIGDNPPHDGVRAIRWCCTRCTAVVCITTNASF